MGIFGIFFRWIKIAAGASGGFLYTYAPDNVAPTTTSIISGIPTEGKILTGSHIYNDIDNDIEGISTYRWLRDGIAIPSAILATYTTSKDDVGKTIVFEVTPIALTGTLIGLPVLSEGVVINKKSSSRGSSVVPIIINGIKTIPPLETISSEPTSTTSVRVDPSLTRTLKYKMTGGDVRALQVYLNTHNYPVTLSGIGSLNNESTYFGVKTKAAVIKFQLDNGLVGDGIVGKMTRGMMK